jgi:glycerate 2-kinase
MTKQGAKLRKDALAVIEAGLSAIRTDMAIASRVTRKGSMLRVGSQKWNLDDYRHVYVIGIGKAAADACAELERILGSRITDGIALDVKRRPMKRIKSLVGSHPFPSLPNMRATGEIIGILKHVERQDLVIAVISGGGSALLCWPYEVKCDTLMQLTGMLMKKGATIQEINTVRKHLSEIQGGQFARLAFPATVIGLIFSDVPGDDMAMVASGPTMLDLTTVKDAQRIIDRYDLMNACQLPECDLKETPKDPIYFQNVTNVLLVGNGVALDAMEREGKKRGYRVRVYSKELVGEAREVGRLLAGLPKPGEIVIAGGETTVTVRGKGKGGRNQELALGALPFVGDDVLVASVASDGIDNSPAAGAIADASVKANAKKHRLNPEAFLSRNDSFSFFAKAGGHIQTGMTGANVSDLMLAMRPQAKK